MQYGMFDSLSQTNSSNDLWNIEDIDVTENLSRTLSHNGVKTCSSGSRILKKIDGVLRLNNVKMLEA